MRVNDVQISPRACDECPSVGSHISRTTYLDFIAACYLRPRLSFFGGVWIRYVLPVFGNALHCRPDFVVHLQLADNTTTRLFAFRGDAAVGGSDDRPRTDLRDLDDDRQRTDLGGLDLRSNASSNHRVELDSVQAASVTDEDYDAKGPQRTRYFIAVIVCFISICFWSVIS